MRFRLNVTSRLLRFPISRRWCWDRISAKSGRRSKSSVFCVEEVVMNGTNLLNERSANTNDNGYVTSTIRPIRTSGRRRTSGWDNCTNVSTPGPLNNSASAQVGLIVYKTTYFNYRCLRAASSRSEGRYGNRRSSSRTTGPLYRTTPRRCSVEG